MFPVRWAAEPRRFGTSPVPPLRATPVHASLLAAVEEAARATGLPLVVTAGARFDEDAALIFSWGRTIENPYTGPMPGKPLGLTASNARTARFTAHGIKADGFAHALDVHPDETRGAKRTISNYRRLAAVWRRLGLVAGADFAVGGTPDWPHVETTLWRALGPKPG